MKIERLNDNQIRCTLTGRDLADRELKISEIAYGSEKAKILFRDMMEQASYECGFEADDIPLMIEAVPISAECIVLTITKVEDPEELDTRFSKFAPSVHEDAAGEWAGEDITDEVMNLFQKVQEAESSLFSDVTRPELLPGVPAAKKEASAPKKQAPASKATDRVYAFSSLAHVIRLAHVVAGSPVGFNSLYKDTARGSYRLVIRSDSSNAESFDKLCNTFSEYGTYQKNAPGGEAYLEEHFEPVCTAHALQSLSKI